MSNSTKKGWVRIHRQLEENELWFLESFTRAQAWIDLFLNANHRDGTILIRENMVNVKRGQIAWSEITMTKRWKWSKGKVRNFLKYLEETKQVIQQKSNVTTLISITNYEKYQSDGQQAIQQTEQQKIPQEDHRKDTNNNVKEIKEEELSVRFAKFMEWFNKTTKRKFQPIDKYKHSFGARLKEGYNSEQMVLALKNMMADEYHVKTNFKYITPEFLLRQDKLNNFINREQAGTKKSEGVEVTGEDFYGSMI